MSFLNKFIIWNGMLVWLGLLYYGPQWWPLFAPHELDPSAFDQAIPFVPSTAWIYQSLFVLLPIAALTQTSSREFLKFTAGFCGLVFCFSAVFWLYPTELRLSLPSQVDWAYGHLIAAVDGRRNAFPSLHAALTTYAVGWIIRSGRGSKLVVLLMTIWMTVLLISTLTTKQHICLDVVVGAFSGWIVSVLSDNHGHNKSGGNIRSFNPLEKRVDLPMSPSNRNKQFLESP
jgi:hypothetical protein